jgi:hypothetical protein
MKMQFVVIGEYTLSDQLDERQNAYGTTDSIECAAVDMQNDPIEFLSLADPMVTMFHIEPLTS